MSADDFVNDFVSQGGEHYTTPADEEEDPMAVDMDALFPPASMTQDEWEAHFADRLKPRSSAEVAALLDELAVGPEGGHDYSTSGVSMSIAARLAFNYVAYAVGASGFQASYAALDAYGKTEGIKGPYGVIKGEEMLYPQYDLHAQLEGWIEEWQPWAKEQAQEKLQGDLSHASPHVVEHWRELAGEDE